MKKRIYKNYILTPEESIEFSRRVKIMAEEMKDIGFSMSHEGNDIAQDIIAERMERIKQERKQKKKEKRLKNKEEKMKRKLEEQS